MTLNEIFRRTGEPTYHTPIAVIGELVKAAGKREKWQVDLTISEREQARTEFNQSGGQVTIINPPFEQAPRQKRWWKRSFRFMKGRFYITFSNCRVKKRPTSCDHECSQKLTDNMREIKGYRYKQQKGLCPECGQPFDIKEMELHHVLPWGRFPELRARKANMILLCHKCHKEIHCNPWKNIEMMKAKADELGIDLKERYDV